MNLQTSEPNGKIKLKLHKRKLILAKNLQRNQISKNKKMIANKQRKKWVKIKQNKRKFLIKENKIRIKKLKLKKLWMKYWIMSLIFQ